MYNLVHRENKVHIYNMPSAYDFVDGQLICMEGRVTIGENVKIKSFVSIKDGVKIGNNVEIKEFTRIDKNAFIGDNVQVRGHSVICEDMVIEGDNDLGHALTCTNHPQLNKFHGVDVKSPPRIIKFARIGTNVTLMPGVVVGYNSIVGAKSLVTKNIPGMEVWVGSPAKFLRKVKDDEIC